ncbi:MAG: CYTH and CHAD domain-containing protein [Alphaproteobacteria bacterium]|nr:CYTH and CHAD domain-containing protein [Alphaproteobacteria bacterium]
MPVASGRGSGFTCTRCRAAREAFISTETELKLALRPNDLPALQDALQAMAHKPQAKSKTLVSTYFDTPERRLQSRRLTLRVREYDGRFIQTVKSAAEGSSPERGEWEDRIAGATPDPEAPQTGRYLGDGVAERLRPVFATEVDRTAYTLAAGRDTRIEAAIDRGVIRLAAGAAGEEISEVELELKRGSPTALYDAALRLLKVAPVRLSFDSKSRRGYRLLDPPAGPPKAVHADMPALDPALSGNAALQRIGRACIDHLLRNEAAALAGDPDGVHQMRVAARRLRAVLSAFSEWLPAKATRRVSRELRWLAGALGPARNLDAFATALVRPLADDPGRPAGIQALAEAAEERRRETYAAAARAILSPRYTAAMLRILRWFEGAEWRRARAARRLRRPIADIAPAVLERRRRAARRHARGFAELSARRRHELRIALKKLRYASEALGSLYPAPVTEKFVKRLKRVQDELGDANDVRVARDILADLARANGRTLVSRAGRELIHWHAGRIARHEPKLRNHLRRLRRTEPFWRAAPPKATGESRTGKVERG